MKLASAITFGLLALIAGLGWRQGRELEALRSARDDPAGRGLAASVSQSSAGSRSTRRPRPDGAAEARRVAAEFVVYAMEMDALGQVATQDPEGPLRRRIAAQMEAVTSLDGRQLRILVEEIAAAPELDDRLRSTLLRWVLDRLIDVRPTDALLALTPEVRGWIGATNGAVEHFVGEALAGAQRDDPGAALAWYEEHRAELAPSVQRVAEARLVRAAAEEDLAKALRLVEEWEMDREKLVPELAGRDDQTPEQRRVSLEVLRSWRREDPETNDEAFLGAVAKLLLGHRSGSAGFEETVDRIERLDISAAETRAFVRGDVLDLTYHIKLGETGRWVEWLVERYPEDAARERAWDLYTRWTTNDMEAAGRWLESAPDGPAKPLCIRAYADVMGKHQPEVARRWLETLPPSPERQRSFVWLLGHWPAEVPGKEDFARAHGLR